MKNIKYISILILLFGFSFVLVHCAKEDKSKSDIITYQNQSIELNDQTVKELIKKAGFELDMASENIENRSTSYRCGESSTIDIMCNTYPAHGTINVPANGQNPSCEDVYVSFTITVCVDRVTGLLVSLTFEDVNVTWCGALIEFWSNLSSVEVVQSEEAYFYTGSLVIEETIVAQFIGSGINQYLQSYFVKNNCYQKCVKRLEVSPWVEINTSYCGNVCCKRTTEWRVDRNGELTHSTPEFEQLEEYGDCSDHPIGKECDGVPVGTCEHECGPVEF